MEHIVHSSFALGVRADSHAYLSQLAEDELFAALLSFFDLIPKISRACDREAEFSILAEECKRMPLSQQDQLITRMDALLTTSPYWTTKGIKRQLAYWRIFIAENKSARAELEKLAFASDQEAQEKIIRVALSKCKDFHPETKFILLEWNARYPMSQKTANSLLAHQSFSLQDLTRISSEWQEGIEFFVLHFFRDPARYSIVHAFRACEEIDEIRSRTFPFFVAELLTARYPKPPKLEDRPLFFAALKQICAFYDDIHASGIKTRIMEQYAHAWLTPPPLPIVPGKNKISRKQIDGFLKNTIDALKTPVPKHKRHETISAYSLLFARAHMLVACIVAYERKGLYAEVWDSLAKHGRMADLQARLAVETQNPLWTRLLLEHIQSQERWKNDMGSYYAALILRQWIEREGNDADRAFFASLLTSDPPFDMLATENPLRYSPALITNNPFV